MHMWLIALIIQAAFWFLFLLGDVIDHPLIIISFVNTLSVLAMVEYLRAIRQFLNQPDRPVTIYGIMLAVLLGSIWFGVIDPDYAARVIVVSAAALIVMFWLAWTLVRHSEAAVQRPAQVSAAFFFLLAVGFLWRGTESLLNPEQSFNNSFAQQLTLFSFVVLPVFGSLGFLLMQAERANQRLLSRARTDDLTGALNRRAFTHLGRRALASCKRTERSASLMLLDLDKFKRINDAHGHAAGDHALISFHDQLCNLLREEDLLARVGGEEFAVLLPGAGLEDARRVAERCRARIAEMPVFFGEREIALRVSIGVAPWDGETTCLDEMLTSADQAMYAAKRGGRNQVVVARQAQPARQPAPRLSRTSDEISPTPSPDSTRRA